MINYTWDFSVIIDYYPAIFKGLLVTLELAFYSLVIGTTLGLIIGITKLSRNPFLRAAASIFIEIFTGLPLLVLLVWLFYALPIFTGLRIAALPTAIIGLSFNLAGFSAEIFRAGIIAVPQGQTEASLALGLSKFQIMRHVILPQAIKLIIPPLSGRYIETIKLSSLAAVIAVDELLHVGQNLIGVSFRPLEVYSMVAVLYLLIIIPLASLLRRFEKKIR